jgi:outer membrane protein OmpA-like peptidoglycan-associated protein
MSGAVTADQLLPRSGQVAFPRLAPGRLVIRTSHAGYAPRVDTMLILGDREQTAIITLRRLEYGGIAGGIYDAATRKPLAGSIVYRGPVLGGQSVDPTSGTFALRSIPAGSYVVTAEGPTADWWPQTCTLAVDADRIAAHDFHLVRGEQTFVFEGVNFATGKADILPSFYGALSNAAAILKANPDVKVEISGHTDPREIATEQYPSNWELSRARAEAVRAWLVDRYGVNPDRLAANGYADTQPVATNDTEAGMAKNRRVEFRVTSR